jgi:hypothetical protein
MLPTKIPEELTCRWVSISEAPDAGAGIDSPNNADPMFGQGQTGPTAEKGHADLDDDWPTFDLREAAWLTLDESPYNLF